MINVRMLCFSCLFSIFLLLSLHSPASATMLELRGCEGNVGSSPFSGIGDSVPQYVNTTGNLWQAGVLLTYGLARRLDVYAGGEYTISDGVIQRYGSREKDDINYSFDFETASFGLRLKPLVFRRWQAYVNLGGIAGRAHYKADLAGQPNLIPIAGNQEATYFMAGKVGLGLNIDLHNDASIGIEAATEFSTPVYDMKVLNTDTGRIESRQLQVQGNLDCFTIFYRIPLDDDL